MLRVRLFGDMVVEVDGESAPPPESARARALLAWLALHPGMHSRAELAARFWPDVLDSSARASLRSAMWSLRRALGEADDPADAVRWAKRWTTLDPLSEEAGRALIGKLAEVGDRPAALTAFDRLAGRLRTELGLAPSAETRRLVEQVRAEAAAAAQGPVAVEPGPPAAEAGRLPSPVRRACAIELVGRESELGELRAAWRGARAGSG